MVQQGNFHEPHHDHHCRPHNVTHPTQPKTNPPQPNSGGAQPPKTNPQQPNSGTTQPPATNNTPAQPKDIIYLVDVFAQSKNLTEWKPLFLKKQWWYFPNAKLDTMNRKENPVFGEINAKGTSGQWEGWMLDIALGKSAVVRAGISDGADKVDIEQLKKSSPDGKTALPKPVGYAGWYKIEASTSSQLPYGVVIPIYRNADRNTPLWVDANGGGSAGWTDYYICSYYITTASPLPLSDKPTTGSQATGAQATVPLTGKDTITMIPATEIVRQSTAPVSSGNFPSRRVMARQAQMSRDVDDVRKVLDPHENGTDTDPSLDNEEDTVKTDNYDDLMANVVPDDVIVGDGDEGWGGILFPGFDPSVDTVQGITLGKNESE